MSDTTDRLWTELEQAAHCDVEHFDVTTTSDLPEPTRRFLIASIPNEAPLAAGVELEMTGSIKLGIWLPFTARQIIRAGTGLVWTAQVGPRLVRFSGADTLGPHGARMNFRLHNRIPIVNAQGPDIDRSAAGRLAAETVAWLPQALAPQSGARWKPIDDTRATVTLDVPNGPVDVQITVNDEGSLTEIQLRRWNSSTKPPGDQPFGGTISSSIDTEGVRIAGSGTVGWNVGTSAQKRSVFFRYEITSARFISP